MVIGVNMSKKPMEILKFIHLSMTDLMTDCMFIMWFGAVLTTVMVVHMLLIGVDMIAFPDKVTALRMVWAIAGVINAIFLIITYCCITEPHDYSYTWDERHEHYGKALAPMLILWPLALPSWACFIVAMIVCGFVWIIYTVYKKLEEKFIL